MNVTAISQNDSANLQSGADNLHGYDYSTYILGALLLVSEVLPLLKNKSNGLAHACLCLITGSKCMLDKVESQVQNSIEESDKIATPV